MSFFRRKRANIVFVIFDLALLLLLATGCKSHPVPTVTPSKRPTPPKVWPRTEPMKTPGVAPRKFR